MNAHLKSSGLEMLNFTEGYLFKRQLLKVIYAAQTKITFNLEN